MTKFISVIQFFLNNEFINTELPPGTVLLDFIRYHHQLTGTKIGCREGDCGACTVLIGELKNEELQYVSVTSCLTPIGNIQHKHIVTVEGINREAALTPTQQALCDESGTQCGFCTPGFVVSMTGFCLTDCAHTQQEAVDAVAGNICRCTGYKSIERALETVTELMQQRKRTAVIDFAIENNIVPAYFSSVKQKLTKLCGEGQTFSPAGKPASKYLGGGTDVYVQQHEEMVHSEINFLFNHPGLKGITEEGNRCVIGGSSTVSELLASPVFAKVVPGFAAFAQLISSVPIRNIATLAGNFSNASPIGDLSILFLALQATIQLREGDKVRQMPLQNFFLGYKQLNKTAGELIEKVFVDIPGKECYTHFEKVSKRRNLDIATVNSAIKITIKNDRVSECIISAGGVAPVPACLLQASEYIKGKKLTWQLVEEVAGLAQQEVIPISDTRGSAAYKKLLLAQLIKAHFITLFPSLHD